VYITPAAITAFETKVGTAGTITYSIDANTGYKLEAITTKIGGLTYTFTMTSGGQITVSSV
jgi:hypothetical protein